MQSETGAVNRTAYLPGLDGLRALAVLAVLAYHADPHWLPGGYLGVEVFFAISGFIITRGLIAEWRQNGRIKLRSFWRRRALRLLPALFLLLAVVLTYAVLFKPSVVADLRIDVLAAMAYVTNWHLILSNQSYFESWQEPSMLRHLWSLAIEEQFYLCWPIFLVLCLGRVGWKVTALLTLLLAMLAYSNMAWQYQGVGLGDTSRVYYGTDTRIGALLLGAVLGFLPIAPAAKSSRRLQALSLAGLIALALLVVYNVKIGESDPFLYQGGFLLTTVSSCVLILVSAVGTGFLPRFLGLLPLRWIGQRSYGIYIWHWPIFLLTWPRTPGLALFTAETLVTIVIAAISYRFLEQPIRHGALGRLRREMMHEAPSLRLRLTGAGIGALSVALFGLAGAAALEKPPPTPAALARTEIHISNTGSLVGSDVSSLVPGMPNPFLNSQAQAEPTPDCQLIRSSPLSPLGEQEWTLSRCLEEESVVDTPTPEPDSEQSPTPEAGDGAPPAQADVSPPTPLSPEQVQGMITAVGDSVMLGAAYELVANIPNIDVDAKVGRQVSAAISILQQDASAGQLGGTLLLHLGNNGTFTSSQFDTIMQIAGPDRKVFFVNVHVPRDWQDPNNKVIADGVARYSNAYLIDWAGASAEAGDGIFISDGVHLQSAGAWLYTEVIQAALAGQVVPSTPTPTPTATPTIPPAELTPTQSALPPWLAATPTETPTPLPPWFASPTPTPTETPTAPIPWWAATATSFANSQSTTEMLAETPTGTPTPP